MTIQKKSSGVSGIIKTSMVDYQNNTPQTKPTSSSGLTIKVANTIEEKEAVYRLCYQVYLEKDYITKNENEWLVNNYDFCDSTVVLMVLDEQKNLAGTLTIVLEESQQMAVDKLYRNELFSLRASGKKLVEISRLVINPKYRNYKEVMTMLFNHLAIYTYHVKQYDNLVIEVVPRHVDYYIKLLCFEVLGGEKPCAVVKGAPVVLLNLPLLRYQNEIHRCHNSPIEKKERTLYQHFIKPEAEKLVACYLENQVKKVTLEEKNYFGYIEKELAGTALT